MANKGVISYGNMVLLCIAVAIYSLSGFFSKLGSGYEFLSFPYICSLCGVILILGIYAILWQIILKMIPLSQAYPFRSLSIVFGLAIAYFVFNETITICNLLGSVLVVVGLLLVTTSK